MLRLSLRDFQFRWSRFVITTLATAIVFSIVLIMTGFVTQFDSEAGNTVDAFNGDWWLATAGEGGPFTGPGTIRPDVADQLVASGATAVAALSILAQTVEMNGQDRITYVVGYESGSFAAPKIVSGRSIERAGEMVVTRESRAKTGEKIKIKNETFTVVGLTEKRTLLGGAPLTFIDMGDARRLFYSGEPFSSTFVIKGKPKVPDGYRLMTPEQTATDALRTVRNVMDTARVIALLLWVAATVLMGAVVYVSSIERTRDFAVLKALGGSSTRMWSGIMLQSLVLALGAAGAGAAMAVVVSGRLPVLLYIPAPAFIRLGVLAVIAGVAASAGGVRRAVKVDPALAFAAAGS